MIFANYDPKKWVVELNKTTITAIAEGGVSWEKVEANGEAKWGVMGDAIWQKSNNTAYKLTVSVMRHCPQKSIIMDLFNRAEPFPVSASHEDLGEAFNGTMALFEEIPSFEGSTEAGDLELGIYVFDGSITNTAN